MSNSEPREIQSPVQLFKPAAEDEGNRSPVKFFGPKDANAPQPAKRQASPARKPSKSSAKSTGTSASSAEESPPVSRVTPTQIPESDS